MIKCGDFYDILSEKGINFFTGVPDSLLKYFCSYVTDNVSSENHIIAANEGNAIALASGHHLATGKIGLVYMQNSGQGNAVNPLVSLADSEVYSIPMLLLIGWRGGPGTKDEPQHIKQGKITHMLLNTLKIPYSILPDSIEESKLYIENAFYHMETKKSPYALIIKKGLFESYELQNKKENNYEISREDAIKIVTDQLNEDDIVVATTGKISRELFEYRKSKCHGHHKDFLSVGSMGHASQISLAVALSKPNRQIYCFDGDGALIMHMGSLAIIGSKNPKNFRHIVFNNEAHDSVGGQPTAAEHIDILKIAQGCNYKTVLQVKTRSELIQQLQILKNCECPALLEIKIKKGAREDLGRPTKTPIENKDAFMEFLRDETN